MKRRHNILLWAGFVLVLLAVGTYLPIFAVAASIYLVALLIIHLLVPRMDKAQLREAAAN